MLFLDVGDLTRTLFHCLVPLEGFHPPRDGIPLLRLEPDGLRRVRPFSSTNNQRAIVTFSGVSSKAHSARIILRGSDSSDRPEPTLHFDILSPNFAPPVTHSWHLAVLGGWPGCEVLTLHHPVGGWPRHRVKLLHLEAENREPSEHELQLPQVVEEQKTLTFPSSAVYMDFRLGILILEEAREGKCHVITYL